VRELGANSGMFRPLGSKVKQGLAPGVLVLATGVAPTIGKLCSHQMNRPTWEMLYQPKDWLPARRSAVWAYSSNAVPVLAAA